MTSTTTHATMADRIKTATTEALGTDYADAVTLTDQAMAMAAELPGPPANKAPDPMATGKISAAWLDGEITRQAATDDRRARFNICTSLARESRARADDIRTARADAILSSYHGLLTDIVDEVRELSNHMGDNVTNASSAVTAGHGDTWRRLIELTADHDQLRAAQQHLYSNDVQLSARPSAGGDLLASDLIVADLDQLWPYWRNPRHNPAVQIAITGIPPRQAPWPEDDTEALLWMTRNAHLWVPTSSQLADLGRQRQTAANADGKDLVVITPHGNRFTEQRTATNA